jgi:hypothetical protein
VGVFAILGGSFFSSVLLCRFLPNAPARTSTAAGDGKPEPAAWIGLAATLTYFMGQGAIWAYLELLGQKGGVARQAVANGLSIATLTGVLGPIAAAFVGPRYGRTLPLTIGLGIGLLALYLFSLPGGGLRFGIAASLFNVAWNLNVPYQTASIAAVDGSMQVVALTASAALAGMSIGPLLAAATLGNAGYDGLLMLTAGLYIVSFGGFVPALARAAGQLRTS